MRSLSNDLAVTGGSDNTVFIVVAIIVVVIALALILFGVMRKRRASATDGAEPEAGGAVPGEDGSAGDTGVER